MSDRWIVIPNWDGPTGFQHYKDRNPRWIKNYVEVLSDPEYVQLTFPQRGLLHGLWLLYAESRGKIPENTSYISRQLGGRVTKKSLDALNHAGFIAYVASNPLAQPEHFASPEVEKRREVLSTPKAVTSQETPREDDDEPDLNTAHQTNGRPQDLTHIQPLIHETLREAHA